MKFLFVLLRNHLMQLSRVNQLRYADNSTRSKTITVYMLVAVILAGLSAYLIHAFKVIYAIAWPLEAVITELIVPMMLICVLLNVTISVFWGSGLLLNDNNIDAVLALPVPLHTLVLSKLSILYAVGLLLTATLLFPLMILFGYTADMNVAFYLLVIGLTLLFPIVPVLSGTLIGTLVFRALKSTSVNVARLKAAGAITVLFTFMLFMVCKFSDVTASNLRNDFSSSMMIRHIRKYVQHLLYSNYLLIGLHFAVTFLASTVLLYTLIKAFRNWYSDGNASCSKSQPMDWHKYVAKQHKPTTALLWRERTRYFSVPVYLTNTACGWLFAAVFVLLLVLMEDKLVPYIYQLADYFQVPDKDTGVLFIYMFSILTTLSCTTYASISIEGKQMDILKSLPMTAACFCGVKILHHLSLAVPTIVVLNTIMALSLRPPFPTLALSYVLPLVYSIFIGVVGYILNLCFPNFAWKNVTYIIKQSLPAILTAIIGMMVTGGTAYLLLKFFPHALFIGSCMTCGMIVLLITAMIIWLNTKGQGLYHE